VEKTGEMSDDPKTLLFNCISQTHALVHRLPLVKRSAWEYEQERRPRILLRFFPVTTAKFRA
jgi:hypothetical protein